MTEDPEIEAYEERKAALRRQIAAFGEEETANHPLVQQLRFELEALRASPPRTAASQPR